MIVDPKNLQVLSVSCMSKPENNEVVKDSLLKILPMYKKVNCFVLDRNCAFMPQALEVKEFKQVKYWTIDCFHATGHKKTCKCNPLYVPRLAKRLKHVNTSAAEQVFAWFRNYARVLNESSPLRHAFKVLYYCKMHNQAIRHVHQPARPAEAQACGQALSVLLRLQETVRQVRAVLIQPRASSISFCH